MSDPKKKLRPEDRVIASLEVVRMKLTDVIDKFYDTQQEMIETAAKINKEIDYIERCKRYGKKTNQKAN